MKPGVMVRVGTALGTQGLIGATVRTSPRKSYVTQIEEDGDHFYVMRDPGDTVTVKAVNPELSVTITNHTSVPVTLENKLANGTVLDDVLKNGRRFHLASGATVKVSI